MVGGGGGGGGGGGVVVVVVLLERFSHLRKRRKSENVPGDMHDSVGQFRISDLGKIATRALRDTTASTYITAVNNQIAVLRSRYVKGNI